MSSNVVLWRNAPTAASFLASIINLTGCNAVKVQSFKEIPLAVKQHQPFALVSGLGEEDDSVFETLDAIRVSHPGVTVLVLSATRSDERFAKAVGMFGQDRVFSAKQLDAFRATLQGHIPK